MNKIFLFGFSCLFIFTVAQGLVCKHCVSEDPVNCSRGNATCTPDLGKCFTRSIYNQTKKGATFRAVTYKCVHTLHEDLLCGKVYLRYGTIEVNTCCNTDRCNGKRAPFPPPNC